MRTVGFSNKVAQTLIAACGVQVIAIVVNLVATGEFSRVELGQVVGLALTAIFGLAGGYRGDPDTVEYTGDNVPGGGPARRGERGAIDTATAVLVGAFMLAVVLLLLFGSKL